MLRNMIRTEEKKTVQIPLRDLLKAVGIDPSAYRVESHSIYGDPNFARNNVQESYLELVLREVDPRETRE